MKKINRYLSLMAFGCTMLGAGAGAVAAPAPLAKTVSNKIYVHLMPWFEAKDYSGYWGSHWTMANRNPDSIDSAGRRQIASYDYPLIGPYSSADPAVVEYQLLLMKLSGVDGVLIDWPGTTNAFDYVRNRQNAEAIIGQIAKVGLEFAVVYEDHNLTLANLADQVGQAKSDMAYLRDNYFNKSEYLKLNNQPLLLDFGPQTLQNQNDWTSVFSVLPTKPYFMTLWYEHNEAGANAQGEFAWIYQDGTPFLTHLTNFYQTAPNYGAKMGLAAPGFNPYYAAGGWGSNAFVIDHGGLNTFKASLDLALSNNLPRIQIATWNDYGEGSDIEPTREYGYGFLTHLQQRLGVNLGQADLELVNELFNQRKKFAGNASEQARLDSVFNDLVSLQMSAARSRLGGTAPTSPPVAWSTQIEAESLVNMLGVQTEAASEGGLDVGWIDGGDWMVWNLNLPGAGSYRVDYRVASPNGGGSIRLENAGAVPIYATIAVPNTGGWQNWQTISHVVTLPAGQQQIAIYAPGGGYNLNWLKFTRQ